MRTKEEISSLIDVASGRKKADIVIKNANIYDVYGGRLLKGDVAIFKDKIAGVGQYSGYEEIDGTDKYVMPTFYDTHLHFESVMIRPSEYLKISIPKGVTSYNADPHEIANVLGEKGIKFMLDDAKGIPADIHFMMPSCVPAVSEDHSGCVLNAKSVREIASKFGLFGLGELMNYVGVVNGDSDVVEKISVCDIIDGHSPRLTGNALNAYLSAGILTDHECETVEEIQEKISKGMYVMIREGSQTRNLKNSIKAVNKSNLRRFIFCTDDRNVEDLKNLGTIGNCVRLAVEECGMDPIDAITIATLNAYEAYGIKDQGAIAPGKLANIILADDYIAKKVNKVFYKGKVIAENGKPLFEINQVSTKEVENTVNVKKVTAKDLDFRFIKGMPVMEVIPNSVVTKIIHPDTKEDLNIMCCIERHDASGDIGHCYIKGINLKGGAVAQTVGHDAHNITVLGDNPEDMAIAVNSLGKDGGLVLVKDGQVIGKLPLEIAGLMTKQPADVAYEIRKELYNALNTMDYNKEFEPFMTLSFMTLIVIPDVKLNHKGLFDVTNWKYIYQE